MEGGLRVGVGGGGGGGGMSPDEKASSLPRSRHRSNTTAVLAGRVKLPINTLLGVGVGMPLVGVLGVGVLVGVVLVLSAVDGGSSDRSRANTDKGSDRDAPPEDKGSDKGSEPEPEPVPAAAFL